MTAVFTMELSRIQPSQLFISSSKLASVLASFDPQRPETLEPIPIKELGGQVIYTDGHTRALAAFLGGLAEIPVFWDEDELDWDAYAICVQWCQSEGITTIADLKDRVVGPEDYQVRWLERCREMQRELEERRRREEA